MKKLLILALFPLITFCGLSAAPARETTVATLDTLYRLMDTKHSYTRRKESRIAEIRKMLHTPDITPAQRYVVNRQLVDEYKQYMCDSAIHYARLNLDIANALRLKSSIYDSRLDLISLGIVAGLYIESLDMLRSLDYRQMTDAQLVSYYDSYKLLYDHNSYNNPYTSLYKEKSDQYRDSLLSVLDSHSNRYKIVLAEKLDDENRLPEARQLLLEVLGENPADTHEKAVVAYALANIYKKEGNIGQQKRFYALSAICDIKNSITENASMQALASVLHETGEVEKAYQCIKSSMEDAMLCNARLRTYEVSQIFHIIDSAYQESVDRQQSKLVWLLLTVSILSVFLIAAVIYVYRQMKRVARIRKQLYQTNLQLNELNSELQSAVVQLNNVNDELSGVNTELSEANQIKEAYIGHFLDLCSTYINKLEKYRSTLNKKAMERKLEELYKILKSREMIDNELKELYENFDTIFLHLYPNFVDEFNSLLREDERFVIKTNEFLNVELRIFALVRLGITDSSRIANFLHYSANTIYSYRTRVRNKAAVPREDFESMVMKIGAIKKK